VIGLHQLLLLSYVVHNVESLSYLRRLICLSACGLFFDFTSSFYKIILLFFSRSHQSRLFFFG